MTRAPSRKNARVKWAPKPRPAPVMRTSWSWRGKGDSVFVMTYPCQIEAKGCLTTHRMAESSRVRSNHPFAGIIRIRFYGCCLSLRCHLLVKKCAGTPCCLATTITKFEDQEGLRIAIAGNNY